MAKPQTLLRVVSSHGAGRMSGPVDRNSSTNRLHIAATTANGGGSPVSGNGAGKAFSVGRNTVDQLPSSHLNRRCV
jgi:hypothetical protein